MTGVPRISHRIARIGVLVLAGTLRLWGLGQNGFDNEYYAAAVRSMMGSWHAFFYNSFDPAGFVSVDKPPLALWIQVASVKLFGFVGPALLLPQVLEGVAAVAVLMHLVGRRFGGLAGTLAGLFLAVTPIAVAVDRSGNTDTGLVLVLLLAAWALTIAVERASRRFFLLAMALVGLGFNVKMLAALVVLPPFALVYWLGAAVPWRRRLVDLAMGGALVAVVALPWMIAYDLTPVDRRPFAGSSAHNSMVDLAVGHNGIGRFVRLWEAGREARADAVPVRRPVPSSASSEGYGRLFVRTPVGSLRLLDGLLAAQVAWLAPLALAGAAGIACGGAATPIDGARASRLLWTGWALTYAVVYSYAGGIFHFYYLSTLGPPLAALAAVGSTDLWWRYREGGAPAVLLPGALMLTAMWQVYVHTTALPELADDWQRRLPVLMLIAVVLSAGALIARTLAGGAADRAGAPALSATAWSLALAALLVIPTAWALSSVLVRGVAVIPSADIGRLRARPLPAEVPDRRALIAFLQANHRGERFLLATQSAQLASSLIIATGEPVMAMGGFHGLDPILTPDRLAALAEARQVRFVMLGELSIASRYMGAESAGRPLADWVRAHGTPVDADLWAGSARGFTRRVRRELYDLRPETGLAPPPGAAGEAAWRHARGPAIMTAVGA